MSAPSWTPRDAAELAGLLRRARRGMGSLGQDRGARLWDLYQRAVLHLARPGHRHGGHTDATVGLTVRAAGLLYRTRGPSARGLWDSLAHGVPQAVRAQGRWVLAAAAWYAAVAVAAGLVAAHSGAWARLLLQGVVPQASGRATVTAGPGLVVMLFFHNALASAAAYAGGIVAGLGSAAALAFNAALVGAILGAVAAHGHLTPVVALLAPHAVLELPATFCAGGGGLAMGAAWLAPGERSRGQALTEAFRRTVPLFGCCVAWLAGAALVEGLFTPLAIPPGVKLAVAGALAVLFGLYLLQPRPGGPAVRSPRDLGAEARPEPPPLQALAARRTGPARAGRVARRSAAVSLRLPEGLRLTLQPAGVPSRALALLVDSAILSVGAGALLLGAAAVGRVPGIWQAAAIAAYVAAFFGLYAFVFEWLGGGATPGKRMLGLAVLRADGRPLDAAAALIRNVMRIVDFLPVLYAAGLATALASGGTRRLGDWAAGTVVVHVPSLARRPRAGAGAPVPLPHVRRCGALPDAAALRRIPDPWRQGLVRFWRRGAAASPEGRRLLEVAARTAGIDLRGADAEMAAEHVLAALDRAALLGEMRWEVPAPRDRTEELAPRAPSPASMDRVPDVLAAAILDFWSRLAAIDPRRRGPVAAALGARLAQALAVPGLDRPDPDALVEHAAHLLLQR